MLVCFIGARIRSAGRDGNMRATLLLGQHRLRFYFSEMAPVNDADRYVAAHETRITRYVIP